MKYRYLKEDFDFFADKLRRGENFTLMRFADGEYSCFAHLSMRKYGD